MQLSLKPLETLQLHLQPPTFMLPAQGERGPGGWSQMVGKDRTLARDLPLPEASVPRLWAWEQPVQHKQALAGTPWPCRAEQASQGSSLNVIRRPQPLTFLLVLQRNSNPVYCALATSACLTEPVESGGEVNGNRLAHAWNRSGIWGTCWVPCLWLCSARSPASRARKPDRKESKNGLIFLVLCL